MLVRFGQFELDTSALRLLREGREVKLERRALDVLLHLVAHPERLVSREELMAEVWQVRQLSPGVLANTVAKLRKALGQSVAEEAPIETVHGRGYRWRAVVASPAPEPSSASDPWIGCEQLLPQLAPLLEHARQAEPSFVLIRGEPGIGKSRLLHELGALALRNGFHVWQGSAYEASGAPPYWSFTEILRAARGDLGEAAWREHMAPLHTLARLLPELGHTTTSARDEAGPQRFRLLDELTRFLRAASASRPVLIALDDQHWADPAALELLRHAQPMLKGARVQVVAVAREGDVPALQRGPLRALSRSAHVVHLTGLTLAQTAALTSALQGAPVAPDAAALLYERTRGNPLFIRLILALITPRGLAADRETLEAMELPSAVRDLVLHRVAALPRDSAELLSVASILGSEFELPVLSAVRELSMEQTLARLASAREVGLLDMDPETPQQAKFVHGVVRDALYAALPPERVGALHAAAALALEAAAHGRDARLLGAIAHHRLRGVPFDLSACVAACTQAAGVARELGGFEVAASLLGLLLTRAVGIAPQTWCELQLARGYDLYCAGNAAGAWEVLREGAQRCRVAATPALLAQYTFRLLDCVEAGAGDEADAAAVLEQALAATDPAAGGVRALLLAHQAELSFQRPLSERLALLADAERLAAAADAAVELEVACCRVNLRHPTQLAEGRAAARKLRALCARTPPPAGPLRLTMRRFAADVTEYLCALSEGDACGADEIRPRLDLSARGAAIPTLHIICTLIDCGRALAQGQFDALNQHIQQLAGQCKQVTGGLAQTWLWYTLLHAEASDRLDALPVVPTPLGDELASSRYRVRALIMFAWMHARTGNLPMARDLSARLPPLELACMPVLHGDVGALCLLAECYATLEERAGAATLIAKLAPFAARNAVGPCFESHGSVAHYLGLLHTALGDAASAHSSFEQAADANRRFGMLRHAARSEERLRAPSPHP